jgi:hypothetical protein
MDKKPTYNHLKRKTEQLEKEIREYVHKEKKLANERRLIEYYHFKRTISLLKINEELVKEINELKSADKNELDLVSDKLRERIKELQCLYDISSLKAGASFSLDDVLQGIVDYIPQAIKYPEITCARIILDRYYEIKTSNFKDTRWKYLQEIKVNNIRIGSLEICYLEEIPEFEKISFIKETTNLVTAIAEGIGQLVEREWAEIEIRKIRKKVEELIEDKP